MLPALSLANHKIEEGWREFDDAVEIESTVIPSMLNLDNSIAVQSVGALKATLIEGVYTAMEGILKEILTVVDGGVSSSGEN